MWGRMKNKMKNLFDHEQADQTSNHKSEEINHFDRKMDAKVSYQYPTNRSFNFPISVDQRRNTRLNRKEKEEKQLVPIVTKTTTIRSQPFRANDVPSPVYGFGYRSTDLEVKLHDDQLTSAYQPTPQADAQVEEIPILAPVQGKEVEHDRYQGGQQNNTPKPDPKPVDPIEETPKQEVRSKKQPFNVRMRPSDKRRYHRSSASEQPEQPKQSSKSSPVLPPLHLLDDPVPKTGNNQTWIDEQAELLTYTLEQFQVRANVINAMQGPSVTRFEIQPEAGVKVSKIKNLSDDIKLNMAAKDIRIEAPIPGKHAIGIEIPNQVAQPVGLQEIFKTDDFQTSRSSLTLGLGLDIAGNTVVTDIQRMPHGLIAGATGSGKSVCINSILISLLYKATPSDVRLLLIDPKMVELAPFNEIPHLVAPVITDVKAATHALKWAVQEMEERYEKFVETGTRDIERYNQKLRINNQQTEKMPYLVIVIDELADLMMAAPQDVEDSICRIAQKARACGIHLLLATQRPSVDVITGLIKANIPTRIAFSVSSQVDSRTIIDTNGAERLLGKGDMLFLENGSRTPVRIQGAFVSDDEIERVINHVRKSAPPNYLFEQEQLIQLADEEESEDDMYPEILAFVMEKDSASTSLLQRHFKIGYNRAARLIDTLEQNGIVSTANGSKPRTILVSK